MKINYFNKFKLNQLNPSEVPDVVPCFPQVSPVAIHIKPLRGFSLMAIERISAFSLKSIV